MKILKSYSAVLCGTIILLGVGVIIACFGSIQDYSDYHFFNPEISYSNYKPFFRNNIYPFYGRPGESEDPRDDFLKINVYEWRNYFHNKIKEKDIAYFLYNAPSVYIDSAITKISKLKAGRYIKSAHSSFYNYATKKDLIPFLEYINFAKQCPQGLCRFEDYSNKDNLTANYEYGLKSLIEKGKHLLKSEKDHFIIDRYNYQILRLYFFVKDYSSCIKYYESIDKRKLITSIKFRMAGYIAGAHYKLKNYAYANYLYMTIFKDYLPMRKTAYLSFNPKEETDWKQCLNYAKNNRERCTLWAMMGIKNDPLRAMKEIFKVSPQSEFMELLLTRAVNIQEESFLQIPFHTNEVDNYVEYDENDKNNYYFKSSKIDLRLISFIKYVAKNGNTNKPYIWPMAAGYLLSAKGKYDDACTYFTQARNLAANNKYILEQIDKFEFISKIANVKKIDTLFEADIVKYFISLKKKYDYYMISFDKNHGEEGRGNADSINYVGVYSWARKVLSVKYAAQGDKIRAVCISYSNSFHFYNNLNLKQSMLQFMDKKDKSEFETFLLDIYPIKKKDIAEWEAVSLLLHGRIKEAYNTMLNVPGAGSKQLLGDPFIIHINDDHDGDHEERNHNRYTKFSFLKQLSDFLDLAETKPHNLAQIYFQIANALYNATYYGNARIFYDTKISIYEDDPHVRGSKASINVFPIYSNSFAEKYYNLAFRASKNKEFKAKCLFMAAKCEQNNYFESIPEKYNPDFKAGKYFHQIKDNYSNTKYYQEIIKECGYFKIFVQKGK